MASLLTRMNHELRIPPFWRIVRVPNGEPHEIILSSGEGWGDGTHETTKLCLQAITYFAPRPPFQILDFGSGSGILSIAGAKLGATVDAVEIDEKAIEHARENARSNGVERSIDFSRQIQSKPWSRDLIVANILRPVLLEFSSSLVKSLAPGGVLILSGLVATDVPEISARYSSLLAGAMPEIFRSGDWRALVWRGNGPSSP